MQISSLLMEKQFGYMLIPNEISRCPLYCTFASTSLFSFQSVIPGYLTCTDIGRLLMVKNRISGYECEAAALDAIKKVKIRKNLFGQYVVDLTFCGEKKDVKCRIQIAKRIHGGDFFDQERHLETFLSIIQKYDPNGQKNSLSF